MVRLTTATGREIACNAVIKATIYTFLTIHTSALSRIEIDQIFDNPAETSVLTAADGENVSVYRGWTILDGVQRSPFYPGSLMIWLTKAEEE